MPSSVRDASIIAAIGRYGALRPPRRWTREQFRLSALRRSAYFPRLRAVSEMGERDGEGSKEKQPRGQEAEDGQEEDFGVGGQRAERARQTESRRGESGDQEIEDVSPTVSPLKAMLGAIDRDTCMQGISHTGARCF
jgi:hypothetical protein